MSHRQPSSLRVFQLAGVTSPAGDSLRSLSTRKLPDGALAMVGATLYYLDKNSGASPNDSDVVAALNGGNWIAFSSAGGVTAPSEVGQVYSSISDGEGGAVGSWLTPDEIVTHGSNVTSLTLSAEHLGKRHRFTAATLVTVTIPTNDDFAARVSSYAHFTQAGTGQIEVAGEVTINTPESRKTLKQFATISVCKVATNEWDLIGLLEPLP
jgi:hypothetical protein